MSLQTTVCPFLRSARMIGRIELYLPIMKKFILLSASILITIAASAHDYETEKDISYLDRTDTLRILAIGNSFSEDAVENNLWELLDAAGIPAIVGNMYIGGCSLESHYNNAMADAGVYRYRKIVGGKMVESNNVKLSEALADEPWTHISLQQVSGLSGLYATYKPYLAALIGYVSELAPKTAALMFHQTWAYAKDSSHPDFPLYGKDQSNMYARILNAVSEAMAEHPQLTVLIPSGTAIQNARTSVMGDVFTRDGFHLNCDYGRYAAACTWFAAITGLRASENPWKPESVDEKTAGICRKAADLAIDEPFKASDISTEPASMSAARYREERCKLDIYYPKGKKGFQTIVWFHGGGLTEGNKYIPEDLTGKGIAIVAVNYRLSPTAKCPAYIRDAAKAVAWTFRNISRYGGDPDRIYVSGHSAGGYLTLMLALNKNWLAAEDIDADKVASYYPISGQTATHYTIRIERGLPSSTPVVDCMAPLGNPRKLNTGLMLFTGERSEELMARFEENLYLKSVLEGVGNSRIPIYEFKGKDHGTVLEPAFEVILKDMGLRQNLK